MTNKYTLMLILVFGLFPFFSCERESCRIDFESNSSLYHEALDQIEKLELKMESTDPYFRIVKTFRKGDTLLNKLLFDEIEFVECHEDSTIIFQAPNCNAQSDFRDVVNFIAYAPKGIEHIKRKRSLGNWKEVEKDWYLCQHIRSLAN